LGDMQAIASAAAPAANEHIDRLVRKRRMNLQYIRRAYAGSLFWMNIGMTDRKELCDLVSGNRAQSWYDNR
jgi:hypothetical protein